MQSRSFVFLGSAGLMLLSYASTSGAVSLIPMEEPSTILVTPLPGNISSMHYDFAGGAFIATTVTSTPLMCANTSAPPATGTTLNPVYYSGFGGIGNPTPRPFVFGASPSAPSVSAQAVGVANFGMNTGTSMQFTGDAAGSLVCYGLSPSGARRLTRDIFLDGADGVAYNSTVTLSVFHVPGNGTDFYGYKIDVTLPPLPTSTDDFALIEGYDSSVFATNAAESASGIQGNWCQSLDGQTCAFSPNPGNINFSYANGINNSLQAPVAPNAPVQYHFIVKRYLRSGVAALPATGAPVAMVALFSPNDLEENKLDDNVATGNNQIANAAPSVTQDATFTSFAGSLAGLNENTDSGTLTFDIADSDTPDVNGSLGAAVTLNVAGQSVNVATDCSTVLPLGNNKASRACTVDIPLNNPSWWNSSVAANYDGLFNTLATDTTNGVYANGVTASAQIVVTDAAGKSSAPQSVLVHIHSTANNAPVVAFGAAMPNVADPSQGGSSFPTYSCSIGANNCGATFHVVEIDNLITALPGPAASFDELASQSTAVLGLQCGLLGENSPIFTNAPVAVPTNGSPTGYDLLFQLTSPLVAGSSLCSLNITDNGSFPNGETAKSTSKQFRIVVSS
jgi:hypothetical protein